MTALVVIRTGYGPIYTTVLIWIDALSRPFGAFTLMLIQIRIRFRNLSLYVKKFDANPY